MESIDSDDDGMSATGERLNDLEQCLYNTGALVSGLTVRVQAYEDGMHAMRKELQILRRAVNNQEDLEIKQWICWPSDTPSNYVYACSPCHM